ncbi:MAG: hypothetical protein RL131_1214 [Bacteroidota bacterium]
MKRLYLLLILLIGLSPSVRLQEVSVLVQKIAQVPGNLSIFQLTRDPVVNFKDYLPENFSDAGTNLVKNDLGLFALIQGTGRVYKLDTTQGKAVWERIDSTFFTGYNYGSYAFTYKNRIYSFGGHGFWQTNGQLRLYNEVAREWNAVTISESIPWHKQFYKLYRGSTLCYFDSSSNQLLVVRSKEEPETFLKKRINDEYAGLLYSLDIESGNWKQLGRSKDTLLALMGISPWGVLSGLENILDVKNNRYLSLSLPLRNKLNAIAAIATEKDDLAFSFFRDSTFYVGKSRGILDSVVFTRADLIDTGEPIYVVNESTVQLSATEKVHYALIGILSLFSVLFAYLYFKNGKRLSLMASYSGMPLGYDTQLELDGEKPVVFKSSKIIELLDQRERSLLDFIYKHSQEERLTTIEEINRVIGVTNRSIEVQKRMRSDLIGSINQKLGLLAKDKKPVLNKQRSDFDKRSFEYFIQPEHMALVERVLNNG